MGRLVMGYWDCPYCEKTHIAGSERNCPTCGHARGEDTKFYMDMGNLEYVPEEKAETLSRNPDWLCSFCGGLNSDDSDSCEACGASKLDSEMNYFEMRRKEESPELADLSRLVNYWDEEPKAGFELPTKKKKHFHISSSLIIALCTILGIAGFGLLLWKLFTPKIETLTITGTTWERSISIEEERTVKESDWSVPSGGRVYDEQEEIHHYNSVFSHYETVSEVKTREVISHYETVTKTKSRQVISHYETVVTGYRDLGNGYFEETTSSQPVYETEYYTESHQEPVYTTETYIETHEEPVYVQVPEYRTKYYYEIERWFDSRTVDTSGRDKSPYWGEVVLSEKEREDDRTEKYWIVTVNKKDKTKTYPVSYTQWEDIEVGDVLEAKVSLIGTIEILEKEE